MLCWLNLIKLRARSIQASVVRFIMSSGKGVKLHEETIIVLVLDVDAEPGVRHDRWRHGQRGEGRRQRDRDRGGR